MKSMHLIVGSILLILLFLAVPAQAQTMTAAQKADIENAVKDKVTQLYASFDSLKAETYVKLWSRNKIMGALTPTGLVTTPDALSKLYKTDVSNQKSHKNEIVDIKVQVLSPEMAFGFGKTTLRIERTNGNIENYNVGDISIWVKESGEWKLAHHAYTGEARK